MLSSISMLTTLLLSISYHSVVAQSATPSGGAGASSTGSITSLAAGLSSSCQTSAGSLLTSDLGSCANIIGLASVIGGTGSLVPPLNNWITAICAADPCSNSTLSSAQQTITSGCSADIQKGSPIAVGLNTIIGNYGSVRDMLCTQYASNSTFCIPSILENIQTTSGQNLTLSTVTTILSTGMISSSFSKVPSGAYCNDCGHALATLSAPLAASANASMSQSMSAGNSMPMPQNASDSPAGVCGASFNDGKIPSSVRVAAKGSSTAASGAKNSAGVCQSASFASVVFVAVASSLSLLFFAC